MPPVPQECRDIEQRVTDLTAEEVRLRDALASTQGEQAWRGLAGLGEVRRDLSRAQDELQKCVDAHSAALSANLVVMDVTDAGPVSRSAQLWEVGQGSAALRETAPVEADAFTFKTLPAEFGISVTTNGAADVNGPDFQSAKLSANGFAPNARVEIVVLPEIRVDTATAGKIADEIRHASPTVNVSGGSISADLIIRSAQGSFGSAMIFVTVMGEVRAQAPIGGTLSGTFTAHGQLQLVPSAAAAASELFDVVAVSNVNLDMPGLMGGLVDAILPMMRETMSAQVSARARPVLNEAVRKAIAQALALPQLPEDIGVSIRRLAIDGDGIRLQPALGAFGTLLSSFVPPAIP